MGGILRQSTTATLKLGPFLSPVDGVTPYTAGGFTVKLSANGGALASRHDATAIAHDADGWYSVEIDAVDSATIGRLKVEVPGSAGNYLPVWDDYEVKSAAVYDVEFGTAAPSTYAGVATTLGAPRAIDSLADGAITVNDALWSIVAMIGINDVSGGASEVFKTPAGTAIRTAPIATSSTNPFGAKYPVKRG